MVAAPNDGALAATSPDQPTECARVEPDVDDGDPANLRFHERDDIDGVSLHLGREPTA